MSGSPTPLTSAPRIQLLRGIAYWCIPLALTSALLALFAVQEVGNSATKTIAATIFAATTLGIGLVSHVIASFLNTAEGDEWDVERDRLTNQLTLKIDILYWLLSWPLLPIFFVLLLTIERVHARRAARRVIDRARGRV